MGVLLSDKSKPEEQAAEDNATVRGPAPPKSALFCRHCDAEVAVLYAGTVVAVALKCWNCGGVVLMYVEEEGAPGEPGKSDRPGEVLITVDPGRAAPVRDAAVRAVGIRPSETAP